MKKWYLSWILFILLLFNIGLLRNKRGRSVWIGMNRRSTAQDPSVIRSARKAIAEDMPWRIRWRWWKQDHHKLSRYIIPTLTLCLSAVLGVPILLGGAVIIDDDSAYAGLADYEPQIFSNRNGQYAVFYSKQLAYARICAKYSIDEGLTWSERIILFSKPTDGDGIIDDDWGGMWELSGEVYRDVLCFVPEVAAAPGYGSYNIIFTKCDISDIANIATFSNWKSADGTPVPSSGKGSNGNGYDVVISSAIQPSVAVIKPNKILVVAKTTANKARAAYWDGVSWSSALAFSNLPANILGVPRVRHTEEGDWVTAFRIDAGDSKHYIVGMRCDADDNPIVAASWKGYDGTGTFDYIIDQGTGAFNAPAMIVDSNNNIHVLAITIYNDPTYPRLWHNYFDGSSWVYGETENSAGVRVLFDIGGTDEPQVRNQTHGVNVNADSGGNIIILLKCWNGPTGAGTYSCFWNGSWDSESYTEEIGASDWMISSEGYMRGNETVSPFFLSNDPRTIVYYLGVSGAKSGNPWWDFNIEGKADDLVKRLTTPYVKEIDSNNYNLLLLVACQLAYIDDVDDDIEEACNIEQAMSISIDRHGELVACFRHTDESDMDYRNRVKDWLHSLIGGGTVEQLRHTVRTAIPGITDDDFEIIDGYGTTGHGVGGHYAHIKVRIDLGFSWVINNLWEMLQRARAACITIDEMGPLTEEVITLSEDVEVVPGVKVSESVSLIETIEKDFDKDTISESLTWSEPKAGDIYHYVGRTYTNSLNIIG